MIVQHEIEEVYEFTLLGSIVANPGDAERDVVCWIGKAAAVFLRLKSIWADRAISSKTKMHLFNNITRRKHGRHWQGSREGSIYFSYDASGGYCEYYTRPTSPKTRYSIELIPVHSMTLSMNAAGDL